MNEKIRSMGGPQRAAVVAVLASAALLTAACGSPSAGTGGSAATGNSAAYRANVAFAQCMRSHGVPNFPDPGPSTNFQVSGSPQGPATTPSAKAYQTCKHLLPNESTSGNGTVTTQELSEGVALAKCIRSHGVPSFPDPTAVNGALSFDFHGVSTPQFQAAVKKCQSLVPAGVKLP